MAEKSVTETLAALEQAADRIGRQTTTLEEALTLFEAGMKDVAVLREILDSTEQKIEIYGEKEQTREDL
ncbi:MAG: exodeoxyribonuclease VII small subunit [Mogibacterium sp.]|nr:exodeoxyribonuclease VII small subunit [Mogibacterium sp.]